MRYVLLTAEELHQPGDRVWNGSRWVVINPALAGTPVGDGQPCVRQARRAAAEYNAALPKLLIAGRRWHRAMVKRKNLK